LLGIKACGFYIAFPLWACLEPKPTQVNPGCIDKPTLCGIAREKKVFKAMDQSYCALIMTTDIYNPFR